MTGSIRNAKGRWLPIAVIALSAFWPRIIDIDSLPDDPLAKRYRAEALQTLALARSNPIQRAADRLLVQRWAFSNWRHMPGSRETQVALPEAADVLVDATALGPWGLPMARYTIRDGGAGWTRR